MKTPVILAAVVIVTLLAPAQAAQTELVVFVTPRLVTPPKEEKSRTVGFGTFVVRDRKPAGSTGQ